jgi:Na+/H+-dicarboxylate symporter
LRKFLNNLIPRSFAVWTITAIAAGILCGLVFGPRCVVLNPLGDIFLRAYSLALLPYLIFEITGVFGGMRRESLLALLKNGGFAILGTMGLGATAVTLLPLMLPHLLSSPLFDPKVLEVIPSPSLIETFLPSNIFSAMSTGNVPAVIFFSILVGIVLQNMKNREPILNLILPLRQLFNEIFGIVAKKVAPFGIFAITASAIGSAQGADLQRVLGLFAMMVVGFIVLGLIVLPGILSSLTHYKPSQIWSALRDPLIIVGATGNIMLAMPMMIEGLKRVLVDEASVEDQGKADFQSVEALVPICFTMFGIGRHLLMVIMPFLAWFHDTPMATWEILRNVPSIFASAFGGGQAALLIELPRLGLPVNLISIYLINAQWLLRISEPLSLVSTITVAFLLFASMTGRLIFRPVRMIAFGGVATGVAIILGMTCQHLLALSLQGYSNSRQIILSRESCVEVPKPTILSKENIPAPAPVTLAEIQKRGVLRAGVRPDSVPWVYRNQKGDLVGYDIDLLASLAAAMKVRLELVEGEPSELRKWISEQSVDCAAGGLHSTGLAAMSGLFTIRYEKVTLAVLVSDEAVGRIQDMIREENSAPFRLATHGRQETSTALHSSIELSLSGNGKHKSISFLPIQETGEFLAGRDVKFDALLTSAEGGSAFAVIHPETTMLPIFGRDLSADMVLVFPKSDEALLGFVSDWILENQNLDLLDRLRRHWILFAPER